MFIHKCIQSSRYFTNRLLEALRQANTDFIEVNGAMKRDINWFLEFEPKFNGMAKYVKDRPKASHTIAIDASLVRVGDVWDNKVYTGKLPSDWQNCSHYNIVHFEMVNIW